MAKLWADDNGSNPDGDYTIDDVSFTKTAAQAKILTFGLPGMPSVIAGTSITMYVPTGTNVTSLGPDFTLSDGATCYQTDPRLPPPPAVVINPFDSFDFTSPLHYWVRSSDGLVTNDYTVTVTESPVETTVIWNTGSGAWDTSSVNWLGEVFGLPAAFSDGQNVIFNRTEGGTITIAADMLPASTTVSASSGTYTFNGGPIGAGALTKSGGGDLTLSNAHSYPGGTTLRGGGLLSLANALERLQTSPSAVTQAVR
ncbi:MAG: hypothetical protein NTW21_40215 [Verrucomicrobia bacterium]|nr:hypothetical protein [Verrucomicrobiota bacterium]